MRIPTLLTLAASSALRSASLYKDPHRVQNPHGPAHTYEPPNNSIPHHLPHPPPAHTYDPSPSATAGVLKRQNAPLSKVGWVGYCNNFLPAHHEFHRLTLSHVPSLPEEVGVPAHSCRLLDYRQLAGLWICNTNSFPVRRSRGEIESAAHDAVFRCAPPVMYSAQFFFFDDANVSVVAAGLDHRKWLPETWPADLCPHTFPISNKDVRVKDRVAISVARDRADPYADWGRRGERKPPRDYLVPANCEDRRGRAFDLFEEEDAQEARGRLSVEGGVMDLGTAKYDGWWHAPGDARAPTDEQ